MQPGDAFGILDHVALHEPPSARRARERRDAAERKRAQRTRDRVAGKPSAHALDKAIVDALRAALVMDGECSPSGERPIRPSIDDTGALVRNVVHLLVQRGHRKAPVVPLVVARLAGPDD